MQCLPGGTAVHAAEIGAVFERWHQGLVQHIVLADGTELLTTRNHPVATHLGFVPAWKVQAGWLVLTVACDDAPEPIEKLFGDAASTWRVEHLQGSSRDFHGDGSPGYTRAVSLGGHLAVPPYLAQEGDDPRVDVQALYEALATCIQPNALGMSTWAEVRRHVPEIDSAWVGQPLAGDESLGEIARDLPPPVTDHGRLSKALVGVDGQVALHRVDQVWTGISGGHVYNMSTATGAYVANGVVVGNCG
jgi:hypothetical protein